MSSHNPIQIAVEQSKAIEQLLTSKFNAVGKGLTEKVKSIEYNLPVDLVKKIKTVAKIRNNIVHEDGSLLKDETQFVQNCQAIKAELTDLPSFTRQLKSVLEVVAHNEDFDACYKRHCSENMDEVILAWVMCFGFGILLVFLTESGIAFLPGMMFSIGILTFLHRRQVKEKRSQLIFNFYQDKFTVASASTDDNSVNEVLYQEVKNVKLVDDDKNIVAIRSYNRGVSEEFKLHLIDSNQSAKQVCQRIHELVFRTPTQQLLAELEHNSYEERGLNSQQTVAGVAGLAGTAYLLSQNNDENADDTSMFAEQDAFLDTPSVNPANGLPMVGAVDIDGNPYGTDRHEDIVMETDVTRLDETMTDSFDSSNSFSSSDSFDSIDSFDNQL